MLTDSHSRNPMNSSTVNPNRNARLAALPREECLQLLAAAEIGRLVVVVPGQDTPLIRPVHYAFDAASQSVVFRCIQGTKLHFLVRSARAWFEVDDVDVRRRTGWSVIITGATEPITQPQEIRRLDSLMPSAWVAGPDARWVRIRARVVSGRRVQPSVAATAEVR